MKRNGNPGGRFGVRRSARNTMIFYLAFGVFGVFGVALLVMGTRGGWILIIFSTAFVVLIAAVTLKPGWCFRIDEKGIVVQRTFGSRRISADSIHRARRIGEHEAAAVVYPDQEAGANSTRSRDMRGAFRAQRKVGRIIAFCTVPIVFHERRAGNALGIEEVGAKTSGDFVLIDTDPGQCYLLSPQDPERFLRGVQVLLK